MPNHCREAAHFFVCVYIILLGLSSIYLSVGFPCDPFAELNWDDVRGHPREEIYHQKQQQRRSCWVECEAYAFKLHFLRQPKLLSNPSIALVNSLVQTSQPNPFCFLMTRFTDILDENPFCNLTMDYNVTTKDEFIIKKKETMKIHGIVLGVLVIDCAVVSLALILVYVAAYPTYEPYVISYFAILSGHIASLFLSSHIADLLTCVPHGSNRRFCDGYEEDEDAFRIILPDKAIGVNNYEISIVIKNVNLSCIFLAGLCYFSMKRSFDEENAFHLQIPNQVIINPPPRPLRNNIQQQEEEEGVGEENNLVDEILDQEPPR